MAESNADVYASFGVNPAVVTSGSVSEHEQAMLELDVSARDGDDAITLAEMPDVQSDPNDPYGNPDKFADPNDDSRMQIRINADGETVEMDADGQPIEGDGDDTEFTPLGEPSEELSASVELLGQHEAGFQEMVNQAGERGLAAESIQRIQLEYQADGISEQSYEELAAAGYSKAFVDSYIKGQEALVDGYVRQVQQMAGGEEKFTNIMSHLESTNKEAAESLYAALAARDLATVKGILNLAGESRAKKFGKPAERSVTQRATPSKAAVVKAEGFGSSEEMVKAMSDPRYRTDSKFRQEVEQKVAASSFGW
ncbi:capsid assembly protein [Pectobacterium phage PP47]|uniref:Capsid assembly protein n=2 Tax=Pektosvirus TaxID=2732689 RepID=A0A1L7DS84_9CAUD|nr:head assembly [Pectobacterium phage PP81]YP_009788737.1 head assembly [Pectobacterium phage PP47]APU03055.1 capsid assembly protein [Pectobacterium phage PP81]APW79775.1 capsid assembly protein [Pectobacterium phage PP47]